MSEGEPMSEPLTEHSDLGSLHSSLSKRSLWSSSNMSVRRRISLNPWWIKLAARSLHLGAIVLGCMGLVSALRFQLDLSVS